MINWGRKNSFNQVINNVLNHDRYKDIKIKFNLQSRKHVSYLRWRKIYTLIENREDLTDKGLMKIIRIKSLINDQK